MFGDFAERRLPKDDLYYSIKNEIESKVKEAEREKRAKDKNPDSNILPTVHKN